MDKNYVDIIMGIYNCENYLEESIKSILNQTYKNWRLIMCDDGSNDNTLLIAKKYCKKYPKKIILLKNDKNMGLNYTLNKCLKITTAKYIARMDADDISNKERLEKEINFLENNPKYSFVSSNAILFDENGKWGRLIYKEIPTKYDFLKISPFCHAAAIIKRKCFFDVDGYTVNKKLLRVEDYHLWFKLYSKNYVGYNIQEYLYEIRDDKNASNRRTWSNRKNEFYVRKIGYKMINIPLYMRTYMFRPIILGILPKNIYNFFHKNKLKF